MADSDGNGRPQQAGLSGHTALADNIKGESLVSSSTAMVTKCERGEEDTGTESLPQTYCASPPLSLPHTHHPVPASLPHTAVATIYTTMAQSSYTNPEIHRTFASAGHSSYPGSDACICSTAPLPEQVAYVSGSVQLRSVGSTLMTQASEVITAEPIDFRRSSVSRGSEVDRLTVSDGTAGDTERSGVTLVVDTHALGVAHAGDVSRGVEPHMENLSRVTLPQTADIGRLSTHDIERAIIHAHTVDRISDPQVKEVSNLRTSDLSSRSVLENADRDRMNEHTVGNAGTLEGGESLRKHTAVDHVERMTLADSVGRGSPQGSGHVSRGSTSTVSGMNPLDTDGRQLPVLDADRYWISVPVTGQSMPFSKMSGSEEGGGLRTAVSLTSDMNAVSTLSTCEAGGIPASDMATIRAVVMSQMDDFNRISIPPAGVISTAQIDNSSPMDTTVAHTLGTSNMDIKYSDLVARSSVADLSRISVLQAHGGYTFEEDRLSIPHMQEGSDLSEQQTVDTKPIILPQTGDVSIVTYPQMGESVGAMAVPQSGNISMVILPQTGDLGQMSVEHSEVRRIDLLPADDSSTTEIQTADGSRMNIQQNGNVIRISLPAPGDIGRYHMQHTDGNQLQIQQMDSNRTILPQTSEIKSMEVEDKADIGRMIALQNRDINAVEMQQKYDINRGLLFQSGAAPDMRLARTSDASALETQQLYEVRANQSGEVGAGRRQHLFEVAKADPSQTSSMRSADRHGYNADASIMSQADNVVAVDRQRVYAAAGASDSYSAGPVDMIADRQRVYTTVRTGVTPPVDSSTGEKPHVYDVARTRLPQAGDANTADRQHVYSIRSDSSQLGEITVMETTGGGRLSAALTDEASLMRIHQAGDFKMSSSAYTDSSIMTLPQTSGVRVVNLPGTEAVVETGASRPAVSFDVKTMNVTEQPHPEYSMRVMAEAAEIMISTGSVPVDDINMRLMAETADFVSRNGPQTSVKDTTRSIQNTQSIHPEIVSGTAVNKTKTSQNSVTAQVLSKAVEGVNPSHEKRTSMTASAAADANSAHITRSSPGKSGAVGAAGGQKGAGEKWRGRSGSRGEKGKEMEQQQVEVGFWIQLLSNQSYLRWRDIGLAQGLHNDEDIACFLMKYYDNMSGVFPSGQATCSTCQQQLKVSCDSCGKKPPAEDSKETKKDSKKTGNDRTKLWKLIVESSPKQKGEEKSKEDKAEQRHRRKPRQTQRVLRRRVIVSPSRSSDEDSQDEPETDTTPSQPVPAAAKVVAKEEKQNTPTPMVTRKRGRPSNDSYHQATTLECPGCQRKFHTAMGLDQHIKRKRCKASKPAATSATATPEAKEPEKSLDKTLTPFKCCDCSKEYRSKQGLLLHRVAKHGEENESLEMALPEADDGEDTDEYVPDQKDGTPKVFQCSICQKEYRSKQGLLMHKASKHSGPAGKKIKMEKEEEKKMGEDDADKTDEDDTDSTPKETGSFTCTECEKTYNSRPGYMLHMKTKHFPMILRDCPECDCKFKTKVELRIHIRREHNKGMLILFCPYCPMIFHNRDKLKTHMDESHKTCRRVLFECVACDLLFSSRIERKRHIQSEHKGKDTSLTCHYCGNWFATRHEYDEHEKAGHPEQDQEWLCAICGDAFPTRYLLQRHALTHKEKILCPLCNKYITEPCYEDHMKRHYGNKTWKCEMCPKSFIRKAELQQHILVHKDERPFCCELCGMRYREKSRLNSHMRTHSGVKPYKCQQCGKCFTRSRELKNHMRVHTGEKPFACSVCGRRFASSGNLSAHRRKVHKLEPIPHGQQSRKHTLEESIKPENKTTHAPVAATPPTPVVAAVEKPASDSGPSLEVAVEPSAGPVEAPLAHTSLTLQAPLALTSITLQAPAAHQAPVAHQDQGVVYQQHMIPKYEPLVTEPDSYIPQPVTQQSQPALAIYWPNATYGEES